MPAFAPLTLAIRQGIVVGVSQVESGRACGCICPSCGEALVAKKGRLVQHHFAHLSGTECPAAQETALHLAAKQAIARRRELLLPAAYVHFRTRHPPIEIAPSERTSFSRVSLEVSEAEMVFDALCEGPDLPLVVEVRVTHAADQKKRSKLEKLGRPAIEIDLSSIPRDLEVNEIEHLVVDRADYKVWLHHPASELSREVARKNGRKLVIQSRSGALHVDWCPLAHWHFKGRPYANVRIHCEECPHAIEISVAQSEIVCAAEPPKTSQLPLFPGEASKETPRK
jgi:hypothetical protein